MVNGAVDLEIMDREGNIQVLETLQQGDMIGQFSMHFGSCLLFRIVAKTLTVRMTSLGKSFFETYGDKNQIEGLNEALKAM